MKRRFFKKIIFSIGILSIIIISLTALYAQEIKIRVIKQGAVLKLKPNEESLTVKNLPLGSVFDVEETLGEWIKIKLPPDKDGIVIIGYIHSSFVTFDIKPIKAKEDITPSQPKQLTRSYQVIAAPKGSFSLGGGISSLVGEGSQYWNTGFSVAMNGFRYITRNILLGGHFTYHRWTPDENELLKLVPDVGIDFDISGQATIIELVLSARLLALQPETQSVNLFAQVGFGYYFINLDAKVKASYLGVTYQDSIEESENKPGVTLGGGIILGRAGGFRFEILPMYKIIFTEDGNTKYFSICVLVGK